MGTGSFKPWYKLNKNGLILQILANFDQGLKLSFPEHGGAGPLGCA